MASRTRRYAFDDDYENDVRSHAKTRKPKRTADNEHALTRHEQRKRERRRIDISKPFKCRRCKSFIGMPLTGGRQRNHCPNCLHSLHVDGKTPGDRRSDCGALMKPAGTFFRRGGDQVLLHRCLGCGFERYNRIAADDNPLLLMRLPLLDPSIDVPTDEDCRTTATA